MKLDKFLHRKKGDVGYIALNNPEESNPLDLKKHVHRYILNIEKCNDYHNMFIQIAK